MKRNRRHRLLTIASASGIALAGVLFYRVREILAALLIFGILFGMLELALLLTFLIDEFLFHGMIWVEKGMAYIRARHPAQLSRRDSERVFNKLQ